MNLFARVCGTFVLFLLGIGVSYLAAAQGDQPRMSFFVTSASPGNGGNLGGLEGADRHCQSLAQAVGAGDRTWRAYLSTQAVDGKPAVNARDRIGKGPWLNAKGVQIAANVDELHGEAAKVDKETAFTEKGEVVSGSGDTPNRHDIITGSQSDGRAFTDASDHTCKNYTVTTGGVQVGHHDRKGNNAAGASWNSAHGTFCTVAGLRFTGGDGLLYCFAE